MHYSIEELNARIARDSAGFVADCEAAYRARIAEVAAELMRGGEDRPVVLLSGPSGSGKTTTAMLLEQAMDAAGHSTHTLSMDNYFLTGGDPRHPRDAEGNLDLEAPLCVDVELLSAQMNDIFAGRPVELPHFNFTDKTRTTLRTLKRLPGEFVILEGIHALNPLITGTLDKFSGFVYVSVGSELGALDSVRIRLLRRLMRDSKFRSRPPADTLALLPSVSAGEQKHVVPFRDRADFQIDTCMPYECSVYRDEILTMFKSHDLLQDETCLPIVAALQALSSVADSLVPADSLIREFLGNGSLKYH